LFFCFAFANPVKAQTQPAAPETQPYGKVDQADLEMKSCDFEKDANAEVLFDKAKIYPDGNLNIMERHIRIKVFNDFGKNQANVRLEYVSFLGASVINGLEAETINLENGKIEVTKLDKKNVYNQNIDKIRSVLTFALPNVKSGSIIEYKYRLALAAGYFPNWYFQSYLPTKYSEINFDIQIDARAGEGFSVMQHISQPLVKDVGKIDDFKQVKALADIHSLPDEPYMGARQDNLQRIDFLVSSARFGTWDQIGEFSIKAPDFGDQIRRSLSGEGEIIKHAKSLKSDDEKIAFIFDTVRNNMKWNEMSLFYTTDGTVRAWDKKTGSSGEINMILCHLLNKSGIRANPMIVGNKNGEKLNPVNPDIYLFYNTVVYIQVDSTKKYVLDATNKFNLYNVVPMGVLNTFGLNLDEDNKNYNPTFLEMAEPAMQSVFLNAEIKPEGKMTGTAEINSYSYNKINAVKKYKTDGEEKYIKYLSNNDNSLKISSLKMEGMEVDTLPLTQKIDFNAELTSSDQNYLFVNTSLFNLMGENPFTSEQRFSTIDFGYKSNYAITGVYKLPAGYKTDALPKSVTIVMPDQSIVFKRIIAEEDGSILVKYTLNHKKIQYFGDDYQDIRGFYKKMYELLGEQIVLKKS
jgi:hypothetical protein